MVIRTKNITEDVQIKCVAIDDEPLALELLEEYISKFPELKLIQTFDDAISAAEFLKNFQIDLLFIDINMPDITGIELVRSLKTPPLIIFTTAYKKFAFDGFELDALDYLLKPFEFERFKKTIKKVRDYFEFRITDRREDKKLFVRSEYKKVQIEIDTIDYIESFEDYIRIYLSNSKPIFVRMTLKDILNKLPEEKFKRVHKSYIVSLNKIRSVVNKKALMLSGKELPIGEKFISGISDWMKS